MRDKIKNGISHHFLLILIKNDVLLIVFCPIIMYLSFYFKLFLIEKTVF